MRFSWIACEPNCAELDQRRWHRNGRDPKAFDDFAAGRDLSGVTVVLDSGGGSVNDAIALGRRWRELGLRTTVGPASSSRRWR